MLKGIGVSPGIAFGRVFILKERMTKKESIGTADVAAELSRLAEATQTAIQELEQIRGRAAANEAGIFTAQILMLTDPNFTEKVRSKIIDEQKNVVWAVQEAGDEIAEIFANLADEYFRERAADIRDIGKRLQNCLEKDCLQEKAVPEGAIIVARELTPSETTRFSNMHIAAIATEKGGPTSHTAIIARALGIPAIVGVEDILNKVVDGTELIIDGEQGTIRIQPSVEEIQAVSTDSKVVSRMGKKDSLPDLLPALTEDQRLIEVVANIQEPNEAEYAVENGADGIGLFRTEFLFMNRAAAPDEEEQYTIYRRVLDIFKGKPVIVRTLDIGGDKAVSYLDMPEEENPFLGLRGIRLTLSFPEILRTQLRALVRASVHGNLRIMFPMITTVREISAVKKMLVEIRESLQIFQPPIEVGVMIEVPAAALIADQLAREVDFFSIGTNDLTQYTLAVDRGNRQVADLYDSYHPAVLNLIKNVVEKAHNHNKRVGLCGELGGESIATPLLVGLGLDELSMSPVFMPKIKAAIRSLSYRKARAETENWLKFSDGGEVKESLKNYS